MKQDIFDYSKTSFSDLTEVLKEITEELQSNIAVKDSRVEINFQTNGKYECQLTLAGDTLIFQMHTNVFIFDDDHLVFKNPYVIEDRKRAYCGIINVYNFLADSFRYNRMSDVGYLIGRIFINKDKHYFVEGPRKIGYLFNDFANSKMTKDVLHKIVEAIIEHALDFDLYTPPFRSVQEVTVDQMQSTSHELMLKTGKRMGFRFQSEEGELPQ